MSSASQPDNECVTLNYDVHYMLFDEKSVLCYNASMASLLIEKQAEIDQIAEYLKYLSIFV